METSLNKHIYPDAECALAQAFVLRVVVGWLYSFVLLCQAEGNFPPASINCILTHHRNSHRPFGYLSCPFLAFNWKGNFRENEGSYPVSRLPRVDKNASRLDGDLLGLKMQCGRHRTLREMRPFSFLHKG